MCFVQKNYQNSLTKN